MAVKTSNIYGKITISDTSVAKIAHYSAIDCYGISDLVSRRFTDSLVELFNKSSAAKGVRVETVNNKINIDLYVILKDGININAVKDSVAATVKYNVETFTGMRVNKINVNIVGVRV